MTPRFSIELRFGAAFVVLRFYGLRGCICDLPEGDFVRFEEINDELVAMASFAQSMDL